MTDRIDIRIRSPEWLELRIGLEGEEVVMRRGGQEFHFPVQLIPEALAALQELEREFFAGRE